MHLLDNLSVRLAKVVNKQLKVDAAVSVAAHICALAALKFIVGAFLKTGISVDSREVASLDVFKLELLPY